MRNETRPALRPIARGTLIAAGVLACGVPAARTTARDAARYCLGSMRDTSRTRSSARNGFSMMPAPAATRAWASASTA